jgi:eukaryotic-like serine/threonine-protein kinase
MGGKVFISHTDEDIQRCAPLLRMLESWQVSYHFDALDRRSGQVLSQESQQALVDCEALLRICTRFTNRSYWMSIEAGALLSLQADDHRAGQPERRKIINLILDPAYTPEPFDINSIVVDTTDTRRPGWVNDLRRALGLAPIEDIVRIAHDINPPPARGMSRRAAIGLGAAGVATLAVGGAGAVLLAQRARQRALPPGAPTPPSRDARLRWSFYAGSASDLAVRHSSISGGVVIEAATLYVGTQLGGIYALSLGGQQLWQYTVRGSGVIYQRPALASNVVYVCAEGAGVIAVQNGSLLWKQDGGFSFTNPVIAENKLFVNSLVEGSFVRALDPLTGATLGNYAPDHFSIPTSGVAVVGDLLYCGTQDGHLYALDMTKTQAQQVWQADTGAARQAKESVLNQQYYVQTLPTVVDGTLYVGSTDFNLYAFDAATGAQRWVFATKGAIGYSNTAVVDGVVYVGSADHSLYAVDARTGKQLWSYATGSSVISSPTVANGKVYLGSGDHAVYELDAQTGALSYTYTTSGKVLAQPTVHSDVLYVCDLQGYVYAFGLR